MASSMLFSSCTFTMDVPPEFSRFPKDTTVYTSMFNRASAKKSTLHAPTLRAILAYMRLYQATTAGESVDNLGAIGTQNGKKIIAEYVGGRKDIQGVVYTMASGSVLASVYADEKSSGAQFVHKGSGGKDTGTAFFFALMPVFMEDAEFKESYDQLYEQFIAGFPGENATEEAIFKLCDNVYRRVENPSDCGPSGVKIEYPATGNVRQITDVARKKGTYSATDILLGEFKVIKAGVKPKRGTSLISAADFSGKFKFSERVFSDREQALIPELPSWYIVPEQIETICNFAQKTTDSQLPMRNFMLRGAAGSGKTEGAKAIAAGLGLPYMFLTCSADDEKFDFIGQILPNIEGINFADATDTPYIPTVAEIDEDPVGAYYNMTGDFNLEITADDVKSEIERMAKEKEEKKKNEKEFRYVYTPLIEAIKNGYVIEIQEPTVISKQGVLVGLNSLLDNCKAIKLITGEVIERHPDTVIILTTNTDYNGCKELNQSIISRMNLIFDMDTPDAKIMTERVMGITGCKDKTMVRKMAEAVEKIIKHCSEVLITDGSCGMRELISWVQSYMICEDAAAAAEYTVLASATADAESRESIRSTCITPVFDVM